MLLYGLKHAHTLAPGFLLLQNKKILVSESSV